MEKMDICIFTKSDQMKPLKITPKTPCLFSIAIIFFILLSSFKGVSIQVDDNPLSGWDKDIIRQANSGAGAAYLSTEEKKLIFYTNLCRLQPKLFCQTVLTDYLKKNPDKSPESTALASLKKQLMEAKPCSALLPDEQLYTIAHDFAKKMGEEGKTGHVDFQNRMKPVMSHYNRVGENCDYGYSLGIDAFMSLLIDKSDPVNLGHRKNILDPNFTAIGVSEQPHKVYQWSYVMDFGGQ